jgi:hypothetical protein
MYYEFHPVNFWAQFAAIELIAAAVISLAFGPGVRLRDLPVLGRAVLGIAFVLVPAAAIVVGAVDATPTWSSVLSTAFFATMFFGLPLFALSGDRRRGHSSAVA